jgi:hypothetical protein
VTAPRKIRVFPDRHVGEAGSRARHDLFRCSGRVRTGPATRGHAGTAGRLLLLRLSDPTSGLKHRPWSAGAAGRSGDVGWGLRGRGRAPGGNEGSAAGVSSEIPGGFRARAGGHAVAESSWRCSGLSEADRLDSHGGGSSSTWLPPALVPDTRRFSRMTDRGFQPPLNDHVAMGMNTYCTDCGFLTAERQQLHAACAVGSGGVREGIGRSLSSVGRVT